MTPLDLCPAPTAGSVTPRPAAPAVDLAGPVRNWAEVNGRPVEVDPEPAAIIDGIRARDPAQADRLRDALADLGIEVGDTPQGSTWSRR